MTMTAHCTTSTRCLACHAIRVCVDLLRKMVDGHPTLRDACSANPGLPIFFRFSPALLPTHFEDTRWQVDIISGEEDYVSAVTLEPGTLVPFVTVETSLKECQERFPNLFEVNPGATFRNRAD